jgi:hypothetical protein
MSGAGYEFGRFDQPTPSMLDRCRREELARNMQPMKDTPTMIDSEIGKFDTMLSGASLFSWTQAKVETSDLEAERSRLEAVFDCKIIMYSVDHPLIRGKKYTRVTWEVQE